MNTLALFRSLPVAALGGGVVLLALALFVFTLRKETPTGGEGGRAQRERAARQEETKKTRLGAGVLAAIGVVLLLIS